jgi:hypothetical protein
MGMFSKRSLVSAVSGLLPAFVLVMALAMPGMAQAAGQTAHLGPFASASSDSGTCGIADWATDTFDRVFTVDTRADADGNFSVEERFANGSFETIEGVSPGSCDTNPGGTIAGGITGTMQGTFSILVSNGVYNPDGCEVGNCATSTATFVASVFGSEATYVVTTFRLEYTAGGQGLSWHTWKNASDDRGGNNGDIAN